MTNNFEDFDIKDLPFLNNNLKRINKAILESLPPKNFSNISRAIHYSVLNGGKRIRPQLVLLMAEALKVPRILEAEPYFPVVQPIGKDAYDFYYQPHFEKWFKHLDEKF